MLSDAMEHGWWGGGHAVRRFWGAALLIGGLCLVAPPARAERDCAVPLSDWQPREALAAKLRAEGWTDFLIRTDDGCYKVRAINGRGERMRAKFNPATLERLPPGHEGDHDHDRDQDEPPGDD